VKSGRVCEECCMAVSAWLSNMAFKPFPGGTRASPCQANFLCKGGSELHKVPRGSERPLCKKANWHIFSPSHGGCFFIREAVAFMQQGRYSGLAALLQARGLGRNENRGFYLKTFRPNLLALRVFVRAGGALAIFLASGMTDRVYRCD